MYSRLITYFAFSSLALGCMDSTTRTETEHQTAPDPTAQYRVVVSLASLGTGIDHDAHEQILAYVNAHDIDLSPVRFDWGLEGERNLCFSLHGLNTQAQEIFVDELEAIAQSAADVTVHEQARCDVM